MPAHSTTFHAKTLHLFDTVNAILARYEGPMTLRQVYYQLVAAHFIENNEREYKALSKHLTDARLAGIVDDSRIIDRLRQASRVPCWDDLEDFIDTVRRSYRREKWAGQRYLVEVWCEKDAVAGVLEPVAQEYEVTLYPCRGYNSYSALKEAGERLGASAGEAVILYLGDFDPSGQDMPRDIRDRLRRYFGVTVDLQVIALTADQIAEHDLPPAPAKRTDTRAEAFIARNGDVSVELDALPPDVLQALVRENVARFVDKSAFEAEARIEEEERARLCELVDRAG